MIRFCDKEVNCILDTRLDRSQIISYFLNGHRNEIVCVLNEAGQYIGMITYDSLLGKNIEDSVKKDFLILDQDIWRTGRKSFQKYRKEFGETETAVIPVLNKKYQLICFAWYEEEANRELRMLDEIAESESALGFKDVFPEYECVTIHECNELAYYFACYLMKMGMLINVTGSLWKELGFGEETAVLEYVNCQIHAEGVEDKEKDQSIRRSVSVEFECIDQIYEKNILAGIISDAEGEFLDVIKKLRMGGVVIIGTDQESLAIYDLLLKYKVDIDYFVSDDIEDQGKVLFGKTILREAEVMERLEKAIFIDAHNKNSAWGFGGVDRFHYWGYKRNQAFFALQDYIKIPGYDYQNIFRKMMLKAGRKLVLAGDPWLCFKIGKIFEIQNENMHGRIIYVDVLGMYKDEKTKMFQTDMNERGEDDVYLLVLPGYYEEAKSEREIGFRAGLKKEYEEKLVESRAMRVADYPWGSVTLNKSGQKSEFKVAKILIGAINGGSGNVFFREILDNHPNIIMIDFGYLNNNMDSICIRLSTEKGPGILPLFWKLCNEAGGQKDINDNFIDKEKFDECMKEMIGQKRTFTSQELFVMIHIAYARMWGKEIDDISKVVIYWEPHAVAREDCEKYALWLDNAENGHYIINIVRNAYIRAGSLLRAVENVRGDFSLSGKTIFPVILGYPNGEKREYDGWKRITIQFEELKRFPRKTLLTMCDQLGIAWSDTLLETSLHGKQPVEDGTGFATGFELTPVYNTYETYFSEFDRFRISLITAPWQKEYGYPYVSSLNFSRKELQKMFMKEFRFEDKLLYRDEDGKKRFKRWVWRNFTRNYLQMTRRKELLEGKTEEKNNAGYE